MVLDSNTKQKHAHAEDDFCNFGDPSPQKGEIELSKFMSSEHETRAFNSAPAREES